MSYIRSRTGYRDFQEYVLVAKKDYLDFLDASVNFIHDSIEIQCPTEQHDKVADLLKKWSDEFYGDYEVVSDLKVFEELGT